jgi:hypothetical protein
MGAPLSHTSDGAISPEHHRQGLMILTTGILVALVGTALSCWAAASLRFSPPGSAIRPMAEAAMMGLAAMGTTVCNIILTILGMRIALRVGNRWSTWLLAALVLIMTPTPWFAGKAVWNHYVAKNALIMKP